MADRTQITKALLDLQYLPNSPITDINVEKIVAQYEQDLGDLPGDILGAAVIHYRTGGNQFFPTSGQLREKATELLLLAMDVPTAAQAWAQVLGAVRMVDSVWCEDGERLFHGADDQTGGAYWAAIFAYRSHQETCKACEQGGFKEVYDHPVVARVVEMMGGRERITDGDISVCRSLFVRGYNEIVLRETKIATMAKPVKETVQNLQAGRQMQLLAGGMKK